jgi:F-type H+-transporting ATPase subunit epsilon
MKLTVLSPHRKLVDGESVDEILAPGFAGQLGIFPNHANLVSELETGILKWKQGSKTSIATLSTGVLEVFDGNITVLADVAELGEEIDKVRAKVAQEKALKKIQEGGLDDANFRKYELKLKRAMARSSVNEL